MTHPRLALASKLSDQFGPTWSQLGRNFSNLAEGCRATKLAKLRFRPKNHRPSAKLLPTASPSSSPERHRQQPKLSPARMGGRKMASNRVPDPNLRKSFVERGSSPVRIQEAALIPHFPFRCARRDDCPARFVQSAKTARRCRPGQTAHTARLAEGAATPRPALATARSGMAPTASPGVQVLHGQRRAT